MTTPKPAWRATCMDLALLASEGEARDAWSLADNEPIPFNHRWEHVQQVVKLAIWLADETGADREVVEAAAWLHDVRKTEPDHGRRGAETASSVLRETDFPQAKVDAVVDAIRQHAGMSRPQSSPLQPLEAAVLWDADKLSKIGVQSLVYTMSCHYLIGKTLSERRQWNREFVDSVLADTVKSMNTEPATRLARERYRRNVEVMNDWRREEEVTG